MSIYGGSKIFEELTPGLDSTTLALIDLLAVRDMSAGATNSLTTQKLTIEELLKFINTQYSYLSNLEPALGNPSSDGQLLLSTVAGTRSWASTIPLANISELHDDFLTGVVTPWGETRWVGGGSSSGESIVDYHTTVVDDIQGALMIQCGATINHWASIRRQSGTTNQTNDRGALANASHTYRILTPDAFNANFNARVGLQQNRQASTFAESASGIYFSIVSGGNYLAVCRSGNIETSVDTSIAYSASLWRTLNFTSNSAGTHIIFSIGGVQVADISTNIPTTGLEEQILVYTANATARNIAIDYWQRIITGLSR